MIGTSLATEPATEFIAERSGISGSGHAPRVRTYRRTIDAAIDNGGQR